MSPAPEAPPVAVVMRELLTAVRKLGLVVEALVQASLATGAITRDGFEAEHERLKTWEELERMAR